MKHIFLINPAAGKQDSSQTLTQRINACCRNTMGLTPGRDFDICISKAPGDITRWAREAAETGEELRLYACGGDGTLNEVVSGAAGHPNAAVTSLPVGSGNDFLRLFSEPEAFSSPERLLDDPQEAVFDLIECNGHLAVNTCSLGLDARIGTQVADYKRLPLVTGSQAYILSALVNTVKGVHHHYRVEINGEILDGDQTMIFVGNGRWYGGGFQPVPDADPTDGLLDVLMVAPVSRLKVLQVINPYKQGKYRDYPDLIRHFRTDRLKITCDAPEAICLDGELRMDQAAEIRLIPQGIRVFYPKNLTWQAQAPALTK